MRPSSDLASTSRSWVRRRSRSVSCSMLASAASSSSGLSPASSAPDPARPGVRRAAFAARGSPRPRIDVPGRAPRAAGRACRSASRRGAEVRRPCRAPAAAGRARSKRSRSLPRAIAPQAGAPRRRAPIRAQPSQRAEEDHRSRPAPSGVRRLRVDRRRPVPGRGSSSHPKRRWHTGVPEPARSNVRHPRGRRTRVRTTPARLGTRCELRRGPRLRHDDSVADRLYLREDRRRRQSRDSAAGSVERAAVSSRSRSSTCPVELRPEADDQARAATTRTTAVSACEHEREPRPDRQPHLRLLPQAVPDASYRLDRAAPERAVDLLPQVADVHVDHVRVAVVGEVPDVLEDPRARQRPRPDGGGTVREDRTPSA